MDLTDLLFYMLSQAPLVTVAIAVLYLPFNRDIQKLREEVTTRFREVNQHISSVEKRVESVEKRVEGVMGLLSLMWRVFQAYNDTLLEVLAANRKPTPT